MLLALVLATLAAAQQATSFPAEDGGRVCADLNGQGIHAVLVALGGRFNKESRRERARAMASKGFRVLAIDFRGFGCSTGPGQADFDQAPFEKGVLAAVRYLKAQGARLFCYRNTRRLCYWRIWIKTPEIFAGNLQLLF
jgi:pimeloyl-ACP methyl ester carboxylesterase